MEGDTSRTSNTIHQLFFPQLFSWTTKKKGLNGRAGVPPPHTAVSSRDTGAWREQRGDAHFPKHFASLTRTMANLSSSSAGSGMGSFRGMLCPLRSACWSMLPAFPMLDQQVQLLSLSTPPPQPPRPLLRTPTRWEKKKEGKYPRVCVCVCVIKVSVPRGSGSSVAPSAWSTCEGGGGVTRRLRAAAAAVEVALPPVRHDHGAKLGNLYWKSTRSLSPPSRFLLRRYPYLAQFRLHSQSVVMTAIMIHACCSTPPPSGRLGSDSPNPSTAEQLVKEEGVLTPSLPHSHTHPSLLQWALSHTSLPLLLLLLPPLLLLLLGA